MLVLPRSSDFGESMAWRIVRGAVENVAPASQERLFLTFPMKKDPALLRAAWDCALEAIGERLHRGLDVAFATEGDPSLYSTFGYLQRRSPEAWPGIEIEVVPGVSSLAAVPAVTGIPLADGQERIAIIPGNYGVGELETLLQTFDTVVLMKIGSEMPAVVEAIGRAGLLDRAVYVSKATMPEQRVLRDLSGAHGASGDCFSMIVVARKERAGVLVGDAPAGQSLGLGAGVSG